VGIRLVAEPASVAELVTALRVMFTVVSESRDQEDQDDPKAVSRHLQILLEEPPAELARTEPRYRLQLARQRVLQGTPVAVLDANGRWWTEIAATGVEVGRHWAAVWVRRVGEELDVPSPAGDVVPLREPGGDG
jgi:hypothetical protein